MFDIFEYKLTKEILILKTKKIPSVLNKQKMKKQSSTH